MAKKIDNSQFSIKYIWCLYPRVSWWNFATHLLFALVSNASFILPLCARITLDYVYKTRLPPKCFHRSRRLLCKCAQNVLPAPNLHRKFNTHWRKWCCRFLYKSLWQCEKERELLGHWNNFFRLKEQRKNICVCCKSFCFLSSKLFSTQSGNKFPCSGGASVISTGALVERHTVALFERLSRQSECFWASGTRTFKRSPCKFQTRARGENKSRCDFSAGDSL